MTDSKPYEQAEEVASLRKQNAELLEAAKLVLAWYEAEDDHSTTDFYERIEMCRKSENAIRAAIRNAGGAL